MSSQHVTQQGHYGLPSDNQHDLAYIAQYNAGETHDGVDFGFDNGGWHDHTALNHYGGYDGALEHDNYQYRDAGVSTPVSRPNTGSDGSRRTRGGRTVKRTDSPLSSAQSAIGDSPKYAGVKKTRGKKTREPAVLLRAPLSVLTKDFDTPLRDMEKWANRSSEDRRKEAEQRNWKIARPMNRFMLYRSAYADRTKKWCDQNNHQVVSEITGQSWKKLEPQEVKDYYDRLATLERENHHKAFPDYKFSPTKAAPKSKAKKRILDYPEEEYSDSDKEWAPSGRQARQPPQNLQRSVPVYSESHYPYADVKAWQFPDPGRTSTAPYNQMPQYAPNQAQMYQRQAQPYPNMGGQYMHAPMVPGQGRQQMHDARMAMNTTPASLGSNAALVSLPGGQHHELLQSRNATPAPMYQQPQQGGNYVDQNGLLHPDHTAYNMEADLAGMSNFQDAMNSFDFVGTHESNQGGGDGFMVDPQLGGLIDESPYQQYLEHE